MISSSRSCLRISQRLANHPYSEQWSQWNKYAGTCCDRSRWYSTFSRLAEGAGLSANDPRKRPLPCSAGSSVSRSQRDRGLPALGRSSESVRRSSHTAPDVAHKFSVETLLNARVHMGHRTHLWNPAMAPYLLGSRNGLHVIDLDKTVIALRRALTAVSLMAATGCSFLWVSPADSLKQRLVSGIAARAGVYFLEGRWVGGTLTNAIHSGQAAKFDYRLPDCIFVIDMHRNAPALNEAECAGIPTVGIADSDCDPGRLTYPIPGNDDGVYAINLYCQLMRLAILEGRRRGQVSNGGASAYEQDKSRVSRTGNHKSEIAT